MLWNPWFWGHCLCSPVVLACDAALLWIVPSPHRDCGGLLLTFSPPPCCPQETLRTSAFPSSHVKEKWAKNLYIAGIAYGRTVS